MRFFEIRREIRKHETQMRMVFNNLIYSNTSIKDKKEIFSDIYAYLSLMLNSYHQQAKGDWDILTIIGIKHLMKVLEDIKEEFSTQIYQNI